MTGFGIGQRVYKHGRWGVVWNHRLGYVEVYWDEPLGIKTYDTPGSLTACWPYLEGLTHVTQ